MSSINYANLKIVNWDFIKKISTHDLRLTKDPKIIRKLIINFLNSSSLFADPSFCPPDLVLKYFQLLQISVLEMANHITGLYQKIEEKDNTIKKLNKENKKSKTISPKYNLPPILFQCVFCSKLFKTRVYLNSHIKRRHPDRYYPIPLDQHQYEEPKVDHVVKTVTNVPELSQDLGPFKAEINAMVDHFDTILKNEQTSIRTDFMEQFNRIDMMVQETMRRFQEERLNTMRRNKGSTDASYSDRETMEERLQATDNSSDTHVYSEHDESDNENEHRSLTASNETYSYDFSLEGQFKKNTRNNEKAPNEDNSVSNADNETPTTTTATIKNGSPVLPPQQAPAHITPLATASTSNYYPQNDYYSYDYSDYYEND